MTAVFTYRYEIRDGDKVVATGHLTLDTALVVGQSVTIGSAEGIVESIEPTIGGRELQLIVRLPRLS
jgi:hypothetical protein